MVTAPLMMHKYKDGKCIVCGRSEESGGDNVKLAKEPVQSEQHPKTGH